MRRDLESGQQGGYDPRAFQDGLSDERIRRGFIQKVYGTVAVQLGATAMIAAPIATQTDAWLDAHIGLMVFSSMGFMVFAITVFCCFNHLLKKHPWNLVILAVFTCLESVLVGFVCATYELQSVMVVLAATAVVAGALTTFACVTKVDVTSMGGYLRAASLALFVLGLGGIFFRAPMLQMVYACGGALLFGGYLVYDTQLVVGGKHSSKRFGVDDYVLAALSIYMDIIRLFMFLLRIFGQTRNRR